MNRVILFHSTPSTGDVFKALKKEAESVFPHMELFRLNFFCVQHNKNEVRNSCKSQSALEPIDFIFHQSCAPEEVQSWKDFIKKQLGEFKNVHFHADLQKTLPLIKKEVRNRGVEKTPSEVKRKTQQLKKACRYGVYEDLRMAI